MFGFKKKPKSFTNAEIDRLTYAIGDVHGMFDQFCGLMEKIRLDALSLKERPRVILLGDYVDRGPASSRVLEEIVRIQAYIAEGKGWCDLEVLIGNHEWAMMKFLAKGESMWLKYGGDTCATSYGVEIPFNMDFASTANEVREQLQARFPQRHRDLIGRMKLTFQAGDYLFVHAGVDPKVPLEEQGPDTFLWIRDDFLNAPKSCAYVVVHGHTPTPQPENKEWRIGVDTGTYQTGTLTAVRLRGRERDFLSIGYA
ncbi:metallophosphoesterase [Asticcacaulis sp. AND118]|uniref:metallophosphoesterase n=1 Tax=Asticcacaulis sp. AND118 TaxID=2840468 RepID=UPI001CFFC288|nr:metallophosphoesterase [Asticcacaulis sp. AND118]UDF05051.1 metallophosphoesterase [Asticcacaulis sp. AND118]